MLNSLYALITRPQPQATELANAIISKGGRAVVYPTFSIEDSLDEKSLQLAIKDLDKIDMAIFVSTNAVEKTMPLLQAFWPQLPTNLLILAVGKSTAQALKNYSVKLVLFPEKEFNSEALLSIPVLKEVEGKSIAIFQGETGRGLLEKVLVERGAKVNLVVCYRRLLSPRIPVATVLGWQQTGINCIIYTSEEGMRNLFQLVDQGFHHWLQRIPSLVVSPRLVEIAKGIRICTIIQSQGAHTSEIIAALSHFLGNAKKHKEEI